MAVSMTFGAEAFYLYSVEYMNEDGDDCGRMVIAASAEEAAGLWRDDRYGTDDPEEEGPNYVYWVVVAKVAGPARVLQWGHSEELLEREFG